ncbi:MAG TPA: hypothetical protein VL463_08030 [Kofleriaceae bacterium]|nr:hypothetical protein [Kofleriaceae bacterium]
MKRFPPIVTFALFLSACGSQAALVTRVDVEPKGPHCADGGSAVKIGADDNGDGVLDDAEVDSVQFVCSTPTAPALVRIVDEPAGANCASGGRAVQSGLDLDHDGTLDDAEVTATQYVCRDADALPLSRLDPEAPGAHCTAGGTAVKTGLDTDGDGTLDDAEITSVAYVCKNALLTRVDVEPAGAHCAVGGAAVESGSDTDGDGTLDDAEITHTEYVCGTTIAGDYTVKAQSDVDALADVQAITGTLTIDNQSSVTAISLPKLRAVGGDVEIKDNTNAVSLDAPLLAEVGGDFQIVNQDKIAAISLPALADAGGVRIDGNGVLSKLSLPQLRMARGLEISNSPLTQELDLSSLTSVGELSIWSVSTPEIALPQLGTVSGKLTVTKVASSSLSAPLLFSVNGDLTISTSPKLASLDLSSLGTIGGELRVEETILLTSLDLPSLDTIATSVWINDNKKLASISMPIERIYGYLYLLKNPALADLKGLSSLYSVGGFYFSGNHTLANLSDLSTLSTLGTIAQIQDTDLQSLGLPKLTTVNILEIGNLGVAGNPKLATLDLPKLRDGLTISISEAPNLTALDLPATKAVWGLFEIWNAPKMKKCTAAAWLAGVEVQPTETKYVNIDSASTCP